MTCSIRKVMRHHECEFDLRSILEWKKLTEPNFLDWLRNIKIILRSEKFLNVLDEATPEVLSGMLRSKNLRHANSIGISKRWPHVWCWHPYSQSFRDNMRIWMLMTFCCTCKSCLVHNLILEISYLKGVVLK